MGLHRRAIKAMFPKGKWKILRGDSVMITAGKDAGQTGVISKVHRDLKKPGVTVKGLNLVCQCSDLYNCCELCTGEAVAMQELHASLIILQYKKHIKRTQDRPGGIVDIEVRQQTFPEAMLQRCCHAMLTACSLPAETDCLQQCCSY